MHKPSIPGPNTKTPKFKMPRLACDAHMHIFGPADKYPYAPDRPYTPPDAPLPAFRDLQAKLGIERAVIVNASVYGTDNRVALDAIAESEGRYRAVTLPCGLGAIASSLMAFLRAGDHLLMPDQLYGPARAFCDDVLVKFAVDVTYYDGTIGAGIGALMRPNTS